MKAEPRRLRVAWDLDLVPSDVKPQGAPELARDVSGERQLGLWIMGNYGNGLGILAIRCAKCGNRIEPMTIAIPDTPMTFGPIEPAQSNPRRRATDVKGSPLVDE